MSDGVQGEALVSPLDESAEVAPAPELWLGPDQQQQTCIAILYCRRKAAALIQVAPWLGLGGGWRGRSALATFSVGTDATVAVVSLFQPPGGDNGGKLRLRIGPWLALETPLDRVRGEGGLSLALRQERFEAWGSFGLRGGVGTDTRGVAYWVTSASWGIYGEALRNEPCWGACDPQPPPHRPSVFGLADGVRFFVSLRRELHHPTNEWTFGLELQPAWFWPLPAGLGYQRWRRH
jgi:hypothetical protein